MSDQTVFFVDDELVQRLLRGDRPKDGAPKRQAASPSLAIAVQLATEGKTQEAIGELERAAERGENLSEIYAGLGHLNFEMERWEEAARHYSRLTEISPDHKTAHYNLGLCWEKLEKFTDAAEAFEKSARTDGGRWETRLALAIARLHVGEWAQALEGFHLCLGQQPGNDKALFGKAVSLQNLGRFDEASEIYRKLLPSNPNSPELLGNMIALALTRREDGKAREYAERLLKIRPQSRTALEGLIVAAFHRSDYVQAAQHGAQLVKTAPDSHESWYNLGVAQQKSGRTDQAISAYKEALRRNPESLEARANLAAAYHERGELDSARAEYPQDDVVEAPGALWNMALLAERDGRMQEAEKHLEQLVAREPEWEDAAFRLGFLQLQRGEYAGAVDAFELCLKKRKNWIEALVNLGLSCWKFEDLDAATETFEKVLELDARNSDALRALVAIAVERKQGRRGIDLHRQLMHLGERSVELSYNLGLLLQADGDSNGAAECYQYALEKKVDFADAWVNLGHALKSSGRDEEAAASWRKAVEVNPRLAGEYFE